MVTTKITEKENRKMENKFDTKKVMEINKNSKVGALVFVEKYEDFTKAIEKSENIADTIGEVEKTIAQRLQVGKDIKAVVDKFARPLKTADAQIRQFTTQYMVENDIERFDGEVTKSITLQKSKTTKGVLSTKQIKVKNKYVDLKDFKFDDLVEMLENLGVKTRVQTQEVTTTKDAGIRVQK